MSRRAFVRTSRQSIQLSVPLMFCSATMPCAAPQHSCAISSASVNSGRKTARGESVLRGLFQKGVRVLLRIVLRELVVVRLRVRHEEHESEMAGMLHGEVDVDVPDLAKSLDGIERAEVRERLGEVHGAAGSTAPG